MPHCVPAHPCDTRIQHELSASCFPSRSQWNCTFTRPYLSGKISSSGGPTTTDFLKITLSEVFVSEYQDAASLGDDVPQETVTLAYGAIKVEFTPQDPTGKPGAKVTGGWDRRSNQPVG